MVCASPASPSPRRWNRYFVQQLLPSIIETARYLLRHLRGEAHQEALAEVVAGAFVMFVALARRGKLDLAYPTVLAKLAVKRFNSGRRVGNPFNADETLSPQAQRLRGFYVDRLDRRCKDDPNAWVEALVEDKTAGPAETAAARMDMDAWMKSLSSRTRRLASYLSLGNRTRDASRKFDCSEGRVSQLRRELAQSWKEFTGGNEGNAA